MSDTERFHVALVAKAHFVPEEPKNSFARLVDALRWVIAVAQDMASDLVPETHNLGTLTGDLSGWESGTSKRVKILSEWRLDDGRFIHIYQIEN